MTISTCLILIMASYGFCFGAMNDKIPFLKHLRKLPLFKDEEGHTFFARMFVCPYCTGFHTGWMVFLSWALANGEAKMLAPLLVGMVTFSFASSASCYLLDTLIQWFEQE
jgi:hypothetical protein